MQRTNIRCLNHANIITAISNAANSLSSMFPYESSHIGLLCWGTPTSNNGRQFGSNLNELVLEEVETQLSDEITVKTDFIES